jgi:hypothetical protein
MEDKKPDEKSSSKHQAARKEGADATDTRNGGRTSTHAKKEPEQQQDEMNLEDKPRKRTDSVSRSTAAKEPEHVYAEPHKQAAEKQQNTKPDPGKSPRSTRDHQHPSISPKEPAPMSPNDANKPTESPTTNPHGSPKSHSILKQPSPHDNTEQEPEIAQAWTVRGGLVPSGAHSQSYLPSLCILTKNRRGRPREVEIQLESPDNSIVSAQILDHKNGTYTIFYCPLTSGEHNLYVNLGGKNIKHGKKVLNFYGKFTGMGAEEMFLARRVLSCIRWQATPGFVELKDKKLKPNPDL